MIGVVVFGAAWATAVSSWFLALAEFVGVWRFGAWAYGLGPCVIREVVQLPSPSGVIPASEVFGTANGKFKLIAPDRCLFRGAAGFFQPRLHTPFPVKGSIRWRGSQAEIEGRIPLFTAFFFAAWLMAWGAGSVMAMLSSAGFLAGLGFLALGCGFAGGIVAVSLRFEVRRAHRVLDELRVRLSAPAA